MNNKKDLFLIISIVVLISLSFTPSLRSTVNIANAQNSSCDNGVVMPPSSSNHSLPVILIHGYAEDSSVWSKWESLLKHDVIPYCTASFQSDDKCGSANDHGDELKQIVQRVKNLSHQNQVNIVGHSKGGLDARVYLANSNTPDISNLIMIGTPNGGGPLADNTILLNPWLIFSPPNSFFCTPALFDLETNAGDTQARENPNTNYYTIYGDWKPSLPCRNLGSENTGYNFLNNSGDVPNDGIVPKWSVESLTNHTNLGSTPHCHTDLLNNQEYNLSKEVLTSRR